MKSYINDIIIKYILERGEIFKRAEIDPIEDQRGNSVDIIYLDNALAELDIKFRKSIQTGG